MKDPVNNRYLALKRFEIAVDRVLSHEGGYVNDPDDPGGETNFGISQSAYPDLRIVSLTRDDAIAIYERDFWTGQNIRHIDDETLAIKVFDIAVNVGPARAIRWLQDALREILQIEILSDGVLGPVTLSALNRCDPAEVLGKFIYKAFVHYRSLAESRPEMRKFLIGWLNRLCDF